MSKADERIDIRGLICPYTLIETRDALKKMEKGQVLEVLCDYEPAVKVFLEAGRGAGRCWGSLRVFTVWPVGGSPPGRKRSIPSQVTKLSSVEASCTHRLDSLVQGGMSLPPIATKNEDRLVAS